MKTAKRKAGPLKPLKIEFSYKNCSIYCSEDMVCPLCGVKIPAFNHHECSLPERLS